MDWACSSVMACLVSMLKDLDLGSVSGNEKDKGLPVEHQCEIRPDEARIKIIRKFRNTLKSIFSSAIHQLRLGTDRILPVN